ncbi:hypothetical protein LTR91_025909 [Friedmanniomyces endolithicus]|uniref:F-box domain-containing protein n=1 Tax=Friedmanniomyces endolithicus TaxID=329885 RepID=A0AAN6H044_9PEZI|nr:hypothetical protein LTS02_016300 [Friedmanniomyces endolithicus]KAK0865895.1 hypothetical protein LTR87_015215 [Friedmanniomyces endolithicus]KAK0893859.1 hypothetical protein LTR57_023792 [Friedmanniomyces endolithicus]KAK0950113.1 hypothetical protein LTR91_025909 [Friedmanniomyces endolithicus]KAK0989915.1 hypothetical protein LTS01_008705 [Friedmanniomyces endolithicus]
MSATHTVLATTELLESILLHLPPSQLLAAHLISRTFAATINSSPPLRRTLWLAPRHPETPGTPVTNYNLNHLLADHARQLGIDTLLQWNRDKRSGRVIIDVYWRSWAHVVDSAPRSSDWMLVYQPRGKVVGVTWSVGFYEAPGRRGRAVGREERKRQVMFEWEDGRLPTLGMLRAVVVERFGVVDWSPDVVEEEEEEAAEAAEQEAAGAEEAVAVEEVAAEERVVAARL